MYKIYPITGLKLSSPIEVVFNCLSEYDERLLDSVVFFPKEKINDVKYIDRDDVSGILNEFPNIESLVFVRERNSSVMELHFVKSCLSILFFDEIFNDSYYSIYSMHKTWADVRLGTNPINENDYSVSIPKYYSINSDTPIWKRDNRNHYIPLVIDYDAQETINKLCKSIINSGFNKKIMAAFKNVYYILPQTDLSISVMMISNILETLLISEKENESKKGDIKKKIAVRAAMLAYDEDTFVSRWILAWHIKVFYEMRSEIIHEGRILDGFKPFTSESASFQYARTSIFLIIKRMLKENITNHNGLMSWIKDKVTCDGLRSGFDYLNTVQFDQINKMGIYQEILDKRQKKLFDDLASRMNPLDSEYIYTFRNEHVEVTKSLERGNDGIIVDFLEPNCLGFKVNSTDYRIETKEDIIQIINDEFDN